MMYIVVEGPDFSGKSHLVKQISEKMKVFSMAEPFRESYTGRRIYEAIQENHLPKLQETTLLLTSRLELFNKYSYIINDRHRVFLSDRSFITSMVYQSEKKNPMLRIMNLNKEVMGMYGHDIIPDVLILMDTDHTEVLKRAKERETLSNKDLRVLAKYNYEKTSNKYKEAISMLRLIDKERKMKVIIVKPGYDIDEVMLNIRESLESKVPCEITEKLLSDWEELNDPNSICEELIEV